MGCKIVCINITKPRNMHHSVDEFFLKRWTTIWSNVKKTKEQQFGLSDEEEEKKKEIYGRLNEKVKETFICLPLAKNMK